MASARDRLNGDHGGGEPRNVDFRIDRFKLDVTNRSVQDIDIARLIVGDPELELAMEEPFAPVLRLPIRDSDKKLLTGDMLTGWTWGKNADDRDEARWIHDGRDVDANLDDQQFRLRRLVKNPDRTLDLAFEDRAKVALDDRKGARKVYRDEVTRAQFVQMLADEVGVPTYIPELKVIQPVEQPDEPLGVRVTSTSKSGKKGGGLPKGLTLRQWDGSTHTLTAQETANAELVLDECDAQNAPEKATLAALEACIVEAPMFYDNPGGDGSSEGILQLTGNKPDKHNIRSVIRRFLRTGFAADTRGAIKLAKTTSMSTGQIAQTCQGSAFPNRYGAVLDSAKKVLEHWGGATGGGDITEEITSAKRYAFKRGRHESSWAAIQRLAEEVNWRAFIRSGYLFYVSEKLLFDRIAPALEIEEGTGGVESIDYEIDLGARDLVAEMTVMAVASRWTALPGMAVVVNKEGAADGKWLVSKVNPSLYEGQLATITLRKPIPVKAEPAPETTTRTVTTSTGGGSDAGEVTGKWQWPVSPHPVTSGFGPRGAPTAGASTFHDGIDIGVSFKPFRAVDGGRVAKAGPHGGYGNYVEIDHGGGLVSFYGHLSKINVHAGQKVSRGQVLGRTGNTGTSTGPHLHLGTHRNGQKRNPLDFLP